LSAVAWWGGGGGGGAPPITYIANIYSLPYYEAKNGCMALMEFYVHYIINNSKKKQTQKKFKVNNHETKVVGEKKNQLPI
jgi:hypothetical protein